VGLFGICSGDAFSWDRQSLLPPLLDLDPTYCQISSPLHISLSELEQVALNFTSLPHQATGAKVLAACATCAGGRRDMRWWPAQPADGNCDGAASTSRRRAGSRRALGLALTSGPLSPASRIVGQP